MVFVLDAYGSNGAHTLRNVSVPYLFQNKMTPLIAAVDDASKAAAQAEEIRLKSLADAKARQEATKKDKSDSVPQSSALPASLIKAEAEAQARWIKTQAEKKELLATCIQNNGQWQEGVAPGIAETRNGNIVTSSRFVWVSGGITNRYYNKCAFKIKVSCASSWGSAAENLDIAPATEKRTKNHIESNSSCKVTK